MSTKLHHESGNTYKRQSTTLLKDEVGEIALIFGETPSEANDMGRKIAHRYNTYPTMIMVLRDSADELPCSSRPREQAGTVNDCDCWACDRVGIIRAVIDLATTEGK